MLDLLLVPLLALGPVQDGNGSDAADERSVKELKKDLKKEKEAEERSKILALLVSLAAREPDDAEDAWEAVATCLQDDAFRVRRETVQLLMKAPDREIAVKSLTAALDKSLVEAAATVGRGAGRSGGASGGRSALAGAFGSKPQDPKKAAKDRAARAEAEASRSYFKDLVAAVATLPDDRSVKSMTRFFEQCPGRGLAILQLSAADGLSQLGTRSALETIRKALDKAAALAEREKELEERGVQGGGRGGFSDGPTAQESAAGLHGALNSAALEAELSDTPENDEHVARNWKKFLSKHSKAFPTKLGKIKREGDG